MTDAAVLALLEDRKRRVGSVNKLAKQLRLSTSYLNDVMRGKDPVGPKILECLGLERTNNIRRRRT